MSRIGVMAMPQDFAYREVFLKGKPVHEEFDYFHIRHPKMDVGKRAKIFAPFDALRGFDFAILSKNVMYEERMQLEAEDVEELNRRLRILHRLTWNKREAVRNQVLVEVTFYVPCSDVNHEAFGKKGRYESICGICMQVDAEVSETVLVNDTRIPIDRIVCIESEGIFDRKEVCEDMWNEG
ncbi:MAG: hypothetical protein IJ744_03050 [Lachnospiraceae bacterium]|nr:hypothetical protein [Lachnospiraceae bacterium]